MGFGPTFRFGNPFFLQPGVDELHLARAVQGQLLGRAGPPHRSRWAASGCTRSTTRCSADSSPGRYLFDSVTGFLRYASPAAPGGFGPRTVACSNGSYVTAPASCPAGSAPTAGPLLFYLQGAGRTGPATDAAGASKITNEELSFFVQDQWQVRSNITLQYGLRWDAQLMPETVDPRDDGVRAIPEQPGVPVGRHDSGPVEDVAAAARRHLGRARRRPLGAQDERRRVLRAPEHAQPGRIGHDQRPAAADDLRQHRPEPAVRRAGADVAGRALALRRCPRACSPISRACASSIATTRIRAATR